MDKLDAKYAVKDELNRSIAYHTKHGYQDREFRLVALWTKKTSRWHTPEEVKAYIQKNLQMKDYGKMDRFGWIMQVRNLAKKGENVPKRIFNVG